MVLTKFKAERGSYDHVMKTFKVLARAACRYWAEGSGEQTFWKCCMASAPDVGGEVQIPTANLRSDVEEGDLEYEVTVRA